jgi:hypothetical protein
VGSSGVKVGDIIDLSLKEVPSAGAFATVLVERGGAWCSAMLTAETPEGYRAEVLQVVNPCE